jgi:Terminase large subunit, T4likevirus-type, N-terminal
MNEVSMGEREELYELKKKLREALGACFVGEDLTSRPTGVADQILKDTKHRGFWCIGPNRSGKTSVVAREIAWWFLDAHPYKPRPKEWGSKPITIIIAGRSNSILEAELWEKKLKPLLPDGTYGRPKRKGGVLNMIVNPENGNRMIFCSHNDSATARKRVEGYSAEIVWLDEMPEDMSFITELIFRVISSGQVSLENKVYGYFYASFTPLVVSEDIRVMVDSAKFPFKKFMLLLEDNPTFKGWTSEALDDLIRPLCASEVEFETRRRGKWFYKSDRVFYGYHPDLNRTELSFEYLPNLHHVVSVDPAASGKVGITVWVKDPSPLFKKRWWCVSSHIIQGEAASKLVRKIEDEIIMGKNILAGGRICDCSPSGFYKEAEVQNIEYSPIFNKAGNKDNSIEEFNNALLAGHIMIADTAETEDLHRELLKAKRTEEGNIVKATKLHLTDSGRYFWEYKPGIPDVATVYDDYMHQMKQESLRRREEEFKQEQIRMKLNRSRTQLKLPRSSSARFRR